ncbi:MAG TPA: ABC transporter substrate-binding protein [Polyangia bacterium]|jgi:ABC-type Fe3+-hydroxamate transport system, periplasmic component|nr:ABC transporter substrate-binding protein [Polyangia bacterium]
MNRVTLGNACALAAAVALTIQFGRGHSQGLGPTDSRGRTSVVDSTGHPLPPRHYTRIVSTNLVTDRLLLDLAEPDRILAFSRAAAERPQDGYRYSGRPVVNGFGPVEELIALRPDLVLSNSFGTPGRTAKLRSAGIEVFDLGELRGVASLVSAARTLAELLGQPERGQNFARSFVQRMNNVAAALAGRPRRTALFLSIIGNQVQGGTTGTASYDVLTAGGLVDVAAARYRGWPAYSAEQLLALAPDLIVTKQGMSAAVCAFPGADHLTACHEPDRIVELPAELLDEPGPAMLEAAEAIYRSVYGEPR